MRNFKTISVNQHSTLSYLFLNNQESDLTNRIRNRSQPISETENLQDVKFKITKKEWFKILDNSKGNKFGGECIYCAK